jgi:hypothetical protein
MEGKREKKDLETVFQELLDKSLQNMEEERDLSLERYRRQDEQITSPEDFILQGKFAVDYLKVAADRSNAMIGVAKMIKDIIYKENTSNESINSPGNLSDTIKREIFERMNTGKNKSTD